MSKFCHQHNLNPIYESLTSNFESDYINELRMYLDLKKITKNENHKKHQTSHGKLGGK